MHYVSSQSFAALQLARHLRHCFEEIGDEAVVCNLEDGSLSVFVDGHDDLAVLHAGQVLDGTADADGNIKLRRDNFARLSNLQVVGNEAGVDGSTRRADGSADLVSKGIQQLKVLAVLQPAPTRNDDARAGELGTVALGHLGRDERRQLGVRGGGR